MVGVRDRDLPLLVVVGLRDLPTLREGVRECDLSLFARPCERVLDVGEEEISRRAPEAGAGLELSGEELARLETLVG